MNIAPGTPRRSLAGYVQSGIVDGPGNAWRKPEERWGSLYTAHADL